MQLIKKTRVDEETFIEYNILVYRKRNLIMWIVISLAVALTYIFLGGSSSLLVGISVGIGTGLLCMVFIYYLTRINVIKGAKAAYLTQKIGDYEFLYTINEKGVTQGLNKNSFFFTWEQIKECVESDLAYYYFYRRGKALAVAKKGLSQEEMALIHRMNQMYYYKKKKETPETI